MNATEVAALHARIHTAYARVVERLADQDPDLDALAQVVAAIDGDIAALPAVAGITGLDQAAATRLAAAARASDAQRQAALAALLAARLRLTDDAAGSERATRAAQAYRHAEGPGDGRFVDQRG